MGVFSFSEFLVNPLINKNYYKRRTNNDINMKTGPLSKLERRNGMTLKKIDDNIMLENYDALVIFLIYDQFGANQKPDSGYMLHNF